MIRRLAPLFSLAFVLGCGGAPPPAAAPPAEAPGAAASAAPQAPAAHKDSAPPAAAAADTGAPAPSPSAIGRSSTTATDAPLVSTITQDAIIAQVQKHAEQFNRCYTLGAGASKTWRAKVTVKATVGPTGVVSAVDVQNSTAKNPKVDACVVEGFKKLSFQRPKGAGTTTFTFPLSFDGMEQVQ